MVESFKMSDVTAPQTTQTTFLFWNIVAVSCANLVVDLHEILSKSFDRSIERIRLHKQEGLNFKTKTQSCQSGSRD